MEIRSSLGDLGENIMEQQKQYVPRCITWEPPDPKVDHVLIRINSVDKPMKRDQISKNFYFVLLTTVDNPTVSYTISWTKQGSTGIHNDDETFLEEKTADEAVEEFDTIEKATAAMDLLYQRLFPVDSQEHALFLKKYSGERVDETVVWRNNNKNGIGRIHEAEIAHVNFRIQHAADPLREWLAKQLNIEKNSVNFSRVPRIALSASGGGLRAAIGTRFFVDQLQREGLLPAISYMSTLSGSTWFMTDWLVNKQLLPTEGEPWLTNTRDILGSSDKNSLYIASALAWHNSRATNLYERSSWFIELWANVIGHGYLSVGKEWDPNETRFSKIAAELASPLEMSRFPWPLMTSVGESELDWFEFTPTQIGRLSLGSPEWTWVEPSAFGCKVTKEGKKVDSPPGDELGQLMATWGSAVTLELEDLDKYVGPTYGYFGKLWGRLSGKKYICPPFESPSWENPAQRIILRDAGLGINVPYPPLVEPERAVDIIIALDISADCWENPAGTLDLFSQWIYLKKHPKFPKALPRDPRFITNNSEEERKRLRKAEIYDLNGVVVVYLPIPIENAEKRVSTYKMKHSPEAQQLIYDTVIAQWNSIKVHLAEHIKNNYTKTIN